MQTLFIVLIAGTLFMSAMPSGRAQDIDSMPPVVVRTFPEAGSTNVAPGNAEIQVVFSKEMTENSWSSVSVWKDSTPVITGKPAYNADHKTWTMKVKLEPGKAYGYWLNTQRFINFKDIQGHSAVPYLLVFKAKDD